MSILTIILNVVFGLISGVFGGLGMGGGTLLIPLLSIFLNTKQKLAQGINLLSFLAMAIVSLIIHFKNGFVKVKGTLIVMIFGVIFSLLGAFIVHYVEAGVLRRIFGAFLCVLSFFQIVKIIKN
ncbi:MAG: sulfite exporter TauE/SafE family protein [Clostridiales bacterium]|nr:sulfite exporter TauE/SafE family protein [Clostridiales bacterium]